MIHELLELFGKDPYQVLKTLTQYNPAALIGNWMESKAIILLSPKFHTVTEPPNKNWFGYRKYPNTYDEKAEYRITKLENYLLCDKELNWKFFGKVKPKFIPKDNELWKLDLEKPNKTHHQEILKECKAALKIGEIYQANICDAYEGRFSGDPLSFFIDIGCKIHASKSAYIYDQKIGYIASFSPETFFTTCDRSIESKPIKGTLPINQDPHILLASSKDMAENIMITDVVRNDIGKIAEYASMTVPDLCKLYKAPGVWHLQSKVNAKLCKNIHVKEIFDALFPAASITGAPKQRAQQLISSWERLPRNVYCGSIGMVDSNGDSDFSVAIRTVQIDSLNNATLGVGGGITWDSNPESEYEELLSKAEAILNHCGNSPAS